MQMSRLNHWFQFIAAVGVLALSVFAFDDRHLTVLHAPVGFAVPDRDRFVATIGCTVGFGLDTKAPIDGIDGAAVTKPGAVSHINRIDADHHLGVR